MRRYEEGVEQFVRGILDPVSGRAFLADLLPFQAQVARIGARQRPRPDAAQADRAGRARHLSGLRAVGPVAGRSRQPPAGRFRAARALARAEPPSGRAARDWRSGRIKQHVVARTLALRRAAPELFSRRLPAARARPARRADRRVRAPRRRPPPGRDRAAPGRAVAGGRDLPLPPAAAWADTLIELPDLPGGPLHNPLDRARRSSQPPTAWLCRRCSPTCRWRC